MAEVCLRFADQLIARGRAFPTTEERAAFEDAFIGEDRYLDKEVRRFIKNNLKTASNPRWSRGNQDYIDRVNQARAFYQIRPETADHPPVPVGVAIAAPLLIPELAAPVLGSDPPALPADVLDLLQGMREEMLNLSTLVDQRMTAFESQVSQRMDAFEERSTRQFAAIMDRFNQQDSAPVLPPEVPSTAVEPEQENQRAVRVKEEPRVSPQPASIPAPVAPLPPILQKIPRIKEEGVLRVRFHDS